MAKTDQGTFNIVSETHGIEIPVFLEAMGNSTVSTTGFYLYAYIKSQNDRFNGDYNKSFEKLSKETGIPLSTVSHYLTNLELFGFLRVSHQAYLIDLPKDERIANGYWARGAGSIHDSPGVKPQRIVMSYARHSSNPFR